MLNSLIVGALVSLTGAADAASTEQSASGAIVSEASTPTQIDTQAVLKSLEMMSGGHREPKPIGPVLGLRLGGEFFGVEFRSPGYAAGFRWMLSGRIAGYSERIRENEKVVGSRSENCLRARAGVEWNSEVRQGFDAVVGFGPSIKSSSSSIERDTIYQNSGGAVNSNEKRSDEMIYGLSVNLGVRRWFVEDRFALRAEVESGPELGREWKGLREPEWNLGLDVQF